MKSFVVLFTLPLAALAAPILEARAGASVIPGQFIVVLKSDSTQGQMESNLDSASTILGGCKPKSSYYFGSFKGYHVSASEDLIRSIAALDEVTLVDYVEPDITVSTNALVTQTNAPWGLARISSRRRGTTSYTYDNSAGAGTYAYIIDTGIYLQHPDFEGRASFGATFVSGDSSQTDGNGHGTHVAGTTGSRTYGIAKRTNLIAVKVLDSSGSGTLSQVISGIQWAVNDMQNKQRTGRAVANLSLGGGMSQSLNAAAAAAVRAGLFMSVAAGNENADASTSSPASEPSVCTVAATDSSDRRGSFSNYGSLVDVFAPGVSIVSTWNDGTTRVLSGTSMATPHVTGLGAYLLTLEGARTPSALCSRIQSLATVGVVQNAMSSNNRLAFNGATR
ncbi:subtilisin-like serine protease-like protein PR1A [Apiospora hydei]|uniref:Subtilisin-like serine protease-like protein PR1A n=1 Tax=Apiospora hydei TaxID=1337664 RepID=A0ABR1XD98_9PEZI